VPSVADGVAGRGKKESAPSQGQSHTLVQSTHVTEVQVISIRYRHPGPKFTDIVLRFILSYVIRSSYDKSYDVVRCSYDIS